MIILRRKKINKGFTLIELLVVIAIIGILSTVVIVALSDAKSKGKDAAIKTNLKSAQKKAETYYYENYNYNFICSVNDTTYPHSIIKLVSNALKVTNPSANAASGTATYNTGRCNALPAANPPNNINSTAWAAQVPLSGSTISAPRMLCVDSTGTFKETLGVGTDPATSFLLQSTSAVCP